MESALCVIENVNREKSIKKRCFCHLLFDIWFYFRTFAWFFRWFMQKTFFWLLLSAVILSSCSNSYNNLFKTQDYDYRYEAAKQCYAAGRYTQCYQLLDELVRLLKGSSRAEESLFMLGMCYFNLCDYETASIYFERYFKTYPKGEYTELARY